MTKLILTRGFSGSGKSTWARNYKAGHPNTVTIERDEIRTLLTREIKKQVLDQKGEAEVTRIQNTIVTEALKAGKDVVIADTNLVAKFARQWGQVALDLGVEFAVVDFKVGVESCLKWNAARHPSLSVPDDVIRSQAKRYPFKNWLPAGVLAKGLASAPQADVAPYNGTEGKPDAIGFDIDGTLAHKHPDRDIYDGSKAHLDSLDPHVGRLYSWAKAAGVKIVVLSGRSDEHREVTEQWLTANGIDYDVLYMRAAGDKRQDYVVKAELFDAHLRDNFNMLMFVDDRNQIVDLWRSMGIVCWQVARGDF